jgi:phosphoribosylformimino-5-aminoimidazole carboxamide ribotide isomerase
MEIIPAIDLRGGKCVRLLQGDYGRETVFGDDPGAMARHWESLGAPRLHVVDLDGAREGAPRNLDAVADIVTAVHIPVEVGGGIRSVEAARWALAIGVDRVVIGTAALEPQSARRFADALRDSVVAGIDARGGMVAVRGWLETTEITAVHLGRELASLGFRTIVYTDIASDGMLRGANVAAMREMVKAAPEARIIASGGVSSVEDIRALREAGAAGAIIGMALYTGKLRLQDALEAARSAEGTSC